MFAENNKNPIMLSLAKLQVTREKCFLLVLSFLFLNTMPTLVLVRNSVSQYLQDLTHPKNHTLFTPNVWVRESASKTQALINAVS